jgi:hypothetical protein
MDPYLIAYFETSVVRSWYGDQKNSRKASRVKKMRSITFLTAQKDGEKDSKGVAHNNKKKASSPS